MIKNNRKYIQGFAPLIAVVGLMVVIAVAGGIYFSQKKPAPDNKNNPQIPDKQQQPTDTASAIPTATPTPTSIPTGPQYNKTFNYPYPVNWKEGPVNYSLMGITAGNVTTPPEQNSVVGTSGQFLAPNTPIHAVVLRLKILNTSSANIVVPIYLRRVTNEAGDRVAPNTKQFYFSAARGPLMESQVTYTDQRVYFIVSEDEKEFTFTTGGASNVFFIVKLNADGSVNVENSTQVIITESSLLSPYYAVKVFGGYSQYTETASLTVQVTSNDRPISNLTASNFTLKTPQVGAGGCSVWLDPKYPVNNRGNGTYILYIITHGTYQGCRWMQGTYIISVTAMDVGGSGTGLGQFTVPVTGKKIYGFDGSVSAPSPTPTPRLATPTPTPTPTKPSQPLSVEWTAPSGAITINRGDSINLMWNASGGTGAESIYFGIQSGTESYSGVSAKVAIKTAKLTVDVPPGNYTLKITYPSSVSSKTVSLTVTGAPQSVSLDKSTIEFDDNNDTEIEIVSNGACGATALVTLYDAFDYEMIGKKVTLRSDRGSADTILPQALVTDDWGEINFKVVSQTVGTSTLSAITDGVELKGKLTLKVLDTKTNDCSI